MTSVRDETAPAFPFPGEADLRARVRHGRSESLLRAFWGDHAGACENFFSGGTDEDEEQGARDHHALRELRQLAFMVERLTWDVLDDELGESDLTTIAGRLSELRNRDEHAIDRVLRGLSLDGTVLGEGTVGRHAGRARTAGDLARRRGPGRSRPGCSTGGWRLDSIARTAFAATRRHLREFGSSWRRSPDRLPGQAGDLRSFAWDAVYDNSISARLEQVSYQLLLGVLPDMVDPEAAALARRRAVFDLMNAATPEDSAPCRTSWWRSAPSRSGRT